MTLAIERAENFTFRYVLRSKVKVTCEGRSKVKLYLQGILAELAARKKVDDWSLVIFPEKSNGDLGFDLRPCRQGHFKVSIFLIQNHILTSVIKKIIFKRSFSESFF